MTASATILGRNLGALILAALFLSATPGVSSGIEIPEKPRPDESPRGVALSGEDALLFAQHSCRDPEGKPLSPWKPGAADIDRLEELLPKYMAGQKTPEDYKPLHEYYRQYIGIVREGQKRICVNFIHYDFVRECLERPHLLPVKTAGRGPG